MPYGKPAASGDQALNVVINGDMSVSQIETADFSTTRNLTGTGSNYFNVDNAFVQYALGASILQPVIQQVSDHPILGGRGFSYQWYNQAAFAPIANQFAAFVIPIEMNNLLPLIGQAPLYLSFYVYSSLTGNQYVALYDNQTLHNTNSYVSRYQVLTANAWQKIVIPVSFPSTLTYPASNEARAISVAFPLIANTTTYLANTFNAWTNNANAMVGADFQQFVNGALVTFFGITDVKIGFDSNFTRKTFQENLADSQRYYQQTFPYGVTPGAVSVGNRVGALTYKPDVGGVNTSGVFRGLAPTMRQAPIITGYNVADGTVTWRNILVGNSGAFSAVNAGAAGFYAQNLQVAGDNAGDEIMIHTSMDARL